MTSRLSIITEGASMEENGRVLAPIPPGEILLEEFMNPLGISRNGLARDLDIPISRVSEIVRGSRTISADTALRLGEYFGTSAEMWLNLQSDFDLRVARAATWPKAKTRIRGRSAA